MNIEKKEKNGINIYRFRGRMDFHPYDLLDQSILKDVDSAKIKGVILDFSELKYISSLGIRYIYDVKNDLNAKNIQMAIFGASDAVQQVFKLLGLYETFSLFAQESEAIRCLEEVP